METKHHILFVGLNTLDMQYLVDRYPEPNRKQRAIRSMVCAGGPATNAAIACACFGNHVDLFTPIGDHTIARYIREDIEKYNVRIVDMASGIQAESVFSSIITDATDGSRTVVYHAPDMSQLKYQINEFNLQKYKIVMFDGFHMDYAIKMARECNKAGITTVLDGGSWKDRTEELLLYIDIAICSDDFRIYNQSQGDQIFNNLHKMGVKQIAITRGPQSILYSGLQGKGEVEIAAVEVADTLGAGDIFHGSFCHYYAASSDFRRSLMQASRIAGESCKWFGTRKWMENKFLK